MMLAAIIWWCSESSSAALFVDTIERYRITGVQFDKNGSPC